jgi:hypothetical protein
VHEPRFNFPARYYARTYFYSSIPIRKELEYNPHGTLPATMKAESPGSSAPATFIFSTPTRFLDRDSFLASFVNDNTATDLSSDLTFMPQYYTADSPTSSLSSPTTQFSFEDAQSSASSLTYTAITPLTAETADPFLGAFIPNNSATTLFDINGSLFTTSPYLETKSEPTLFVNPFDSFGEMAYPPFEFKTDPVHRSIEMPASPQLDSVPTFPRFPQYERDISGSVFERSITGGARPFQHSLPAFSSSYTTSSEDTMSELPLSPPLTKKPSRITKQDKGIKCDHCGVEKTPLWRKVPNKENAYHWYVSLLTRILTIATHVDYTTNLMVISALWRVKAELFEPRNLVKQAIHMYPSRSVRVPLPPTATSLAPIAEQTTLCFGARVQMVNLRYVTHAASTTSSTARTAHQRRGRRFIAGTELAKNRDSA